MSDSDDQGVEEKVVKGANVFRLVQHETYVGLLIDCQDEDLAKVAYEDILDSCRKNGGVSITVQGMPDTTPMVFERGVHYSDDSDGKPE